MSKWLVVVVACLVLALAMPAMAERETKTTVSEITVLGQACAVVQTVDRGGPAGKGFFGTTRVSQTVIAKNKKGELVQVSQYGSASDGIGKDIAKGVVPVATGGFFYVWGQQTRRPDNYANTTNVRTGAGAGAITLKNAQDQGQVGLNCNSVRNSNFQAQGQLQGQIQGQQQGQGQSTGFCSPVNVGDGF